MRKRKHFYTVISLIAGVIILTTAAAANYGNANGYTAYKTALKNMLYADNFTSRVGMELIFDGESVASAENVFMLDSDGKVVSYTATSETEDERRYRAESWIVRDDKHEENEAGYLSINKSNKIWNIYRTYYNGWSGIEDDEVTRKAVRFAELLADTFVGDLKNNFVLTSSENGVRSYQIILSGNQLPEYVSAGISMLFSAARQETRSFVAYDPDFDAEADEFEKASSDAWNMLYEKQHKGVVYVDKDGKLIYFPTDRDYYESEYYQADLSNLQNILRSIVTEPVVETAKCFITVDAEGRLHSNTLEGTLAAYDNAGSKHTVTLRISADIKDYGTTTIDMPVIPKGDKVNDYSSPNAFGRESHTEVKGAMVTTVMEDFSGS